MDAYQLTDFLHAWAHEPTAAERDLVPQVRASYPTCGYQGEVYLAVALDPAVLARVVPWQDGEADLAQAEAAVRAVLGTWVAPQAWSTSLVDACHRLQHAHPEVDTPVFLLRATVDGLDLDALARLHGVPGLYPVSAPVVAALPATYEVLGYLDLTGQVLPDYHFAQAYPPLAPQLIRDVDYWVENYGADFYARWCPRILVGEDPRYLSEHYVGYPRFSVIGG